MRKPSLIESMAFVNLYRELGALLTYSRHPDPEPLSDGWLNSARERIRESTGSAEEVAIRIGNHKIRDKVIRARSVALDYVVRIHSDPTLAATQARYWALQDDRSVFSELSELCDEFRRFSDTYHDPEAAEDAAIESDAEVETGVPILLEQDDQAIVSDPTTDELHHEKSGKASKAIKESCPDEFIGWIEKSALRYHLKTHGKVWLSKSGWSKFLKNLKAENLAVDNEPGKGQRTIRVSVDAFKRMGIPTPHQD